MQSVQTLAALIDHTVLKPEATLTDIDQLIDEALQYQFAAVCLNPIYVSHTREKLASDNHDVNICTVVGFPLGANTTQAKTEEARDAATNGADEIDIVSHLPYLLNADVTQIAEELKPIIAAARSVNPDVSVKVIVESALLLKDADDQLAEKRIAAACQAIHNAGGNYIKTSTGFHPAGGASLQAVQLMNQFADGLKIKASGGIRSYEDAKQYIDIGVQRLGVSAGVKIINEFQSPA